MNDKDTQAGLINVVMGGALLLALLAFKTLGSKTELVYWAATLTFFIHWYWGLHYFIKHLGATGNLFEIGLDFAIVGVVVSTLFWISVPLIWFSLNAAAFFLAAVKYVLALATRKLSAAKKKYAVAKLRIEVMAIILFLIGVAQICYFPHLRAVLGLAVIASHGLTVLLMTTVLKIYTLKD